MKIATWNINNRVGRVRFRPEAANASIALGADILVFNEYYPKEHATAFIGALAEAGWSSHMLSADTGEVANRVLIASRFPLQPLSMSPPVFDRQFPTNILGVSLPTLGLSIVGIRIPWYDGKDAGLVLDAWNWLQSTAANLVDQPSIILGDLNVGLKSFRSRGGDHFRRILQAGWHRATPNGASFYNEKGHKSEIDHILGTRFCDFSNARYVNECGGFLLAGGKVAISDHAALVADVVVRETAQIPAG